jgi:ADP-ribose pyrophosphatase YjhB (NUDIX family)
MNVRDAYCHACGTKFPEPLSYPRTCPTCALQVWSNPIPVSVVLLPVETPDGLGLLCCRRSIEPKKGMLALTGGFLESHETWQQGGAREVREETDVVISPDSLTAFWFTSTRPNPNRVLLFSVATPVARAALPPFTPTNETSERGLIFGPEGLESLFAFDLHVEAVRRFFRERGLTGPHRYVQA